MAKTFQCKKANRLELGVKKGTELSVHEQSPNLSDHLMSGQEQKEEEDDGQQDDYDGIEL